MVGLVVALVSAVRVALRAPDAWGEKRTLTVQSELSGSEAGQVSELMKKSSGLVPVKV
jgi:hypothetical protein